MNKTMKTFIECLIILGFWGAALILGSYTMILLVRSFPQEMGL